MRPGLCITVQTTLQLNPEYIKPEHYNISFQRLLQSSGLCHLGLAYISVQMCTYDLLPNFASALYAYEYFEGQRVEVRHNLFYFRQVVSLAARIASTAAKAGLGARIPDIVDWLLSTFNSNNVQQWIATHGGWVGMMLHKFIECEEWVFQSECVYVGRSW